MVERYRSRISGPLLDRIDIHLPVPAVAADDLSVGGAQPEASVTIRLRVEAARRVQRERFRGQPGIYGNAQMTSRDVRRHCRLDAHADSFLRQAIGQLGISARAYTRVLKLARTIADLVGAPEIEQAHLAEAIQYRLLDRHRLPPLHSGRHPRTQ